MIELSKPNETEINVKIINGDSFYCDLDRIKSIQGRRWNPDLKVWTIPADQLGFLEQIFYPNEIIWNRDIVPEPEEEKVDADKFHLPKFEVSLDYLDELKLQLYDFQVIGSCFLADVKKGLLGDEMGLGKTPQAIGAAYKLYRQKKAEKALVICPASLKYQWAEEIKKFTDLSSTVIDGTKAQRPEQYAQETFFTITNYELLLHDLDYMLEMFPDIIICDEVHRIKNHATKTSKAILKLDAPYKWGLTGTPIQNRPDEIFNVFAFLDDTILGNFWKFRARYIHVGDAYGRKNVPLGPKNLPELHNRLSPYMLRRLKKDVAPDLPDVIYNTILIDMHRDQKQLHEIVFNDFKQLMDTIESKVVRNELGDIVKKPPEADKGLAYFIIMQQIANSLELLDMSESSMVRGYNIKSKASPKLDHLYDICEERLDNNPNCKTVIFTQFEKMQRLIEKKLSKLGKSVIINGSVAHKTRQERINAFKEDPDIKFFLSSDAGNYGINLENSDCVISVDIPWNPAVYQQRNNRIHRMTSKFDKVEVITLISRGSVDEMILRSMYKKKEMSDEIIEYSEEKKEALNSMTIKQLKKIMSNFG